MGFFRLASVFALSVTRKADVANSYTRLAEEQFKRAKARDSQQVTTQGLGLNRFIVQDSMAFIKR